MFNYQRGIYILYRYKQQKKSEIIPPLRKSHNLKENSSASSSPQLSYVICVHERSKTAALLHTVLNAIDMSKLIPAELETVFPHFWICPGCLGNASIAIASWNLSFQL